MACQNIWTLEYGPPEILKYGPVRITHEKKVVHFTQIWVIRTTFTKLAAQTPHILNQFLLQKGSLVQGMVHIPILQWYINTKSCSATV